MTQQTNYDQEDDILKKGTLVCFSCSVWGETTKIRTKDILNTDAERDLIDNVKHKIDKNWLAPLKKLRSRAREYLYNRAYTFPIPGFIFVPRGNITNIDEAMQSFAGEFDSLIDQFMLKYPEYIDEMRRRLGSLYNPLDYPSDLRSHFAFSWKFVNLSSESNTELLSPDVIRREETSFRQMVDEFKDTAMTTLRTTFAEMVNRTVERLSGEKKIFRDTLIGNIREFVDGFATMNINDDEELAAAVDKCNRILNGVSIDAIRSNEQLRHNIANSMQAVQGQLAGMMIGAPIRKLRKVG
jgi:hypothetical protein